MVQTLEQYILVHRAVKELFLEQMRVIDSHPYENVDDDGHPLVDNKEDTDYETVVVSFFLIRIKNVSASLSTYVDEKCPNINRKITFLNGVFDREGLTKRS